MTKKMNALIQHFKDKYNKLGLSLWKKDNVVRFYDNEGNFINLKTGYATNKRLYQLADDKKFNELKKEVNKIFKTEYDLHKKYINEVIVYKKDDCIDITIQFNDSFWNDFPDITEEKIKSIILDDLNKLKTPPFQRT